MISKKATAGLLTGASLAALAMSGGAALAAGSNFSGPFPAGLVIAADTDFVILENDFVSGADVINQAQVGPGNPEGVGFLVREDAVINGALINTALATITAIDQVLSNPATATGLRVDGTVEQVVNDGSISALAISTASFFGGTEPDATARGVHYNALGSAIGAISLWNTGDIEANAAAYVNAASGGDANALAIGVDEHATGNDGAVGSVATIETVNEGTITAIAHAVATATATVATGTETGRAWGIATATGIHQIARSAETVAASLTNTGNIIAEASISAIGFGDNHAEGSDAIAVGVSQSAFATGSEELAARVQLNNTGSIAASADVFASGDAFSYANARATGVHQNTENAKISSALVTNDGGIHVQATGEAFGSGAVGNATVTGIYQAASANGILGSEAAAAVINSSSLEIIANALGHGSSSGANVSALASGIYQDVSYAETASAQIDNDGTITVVADARGLTTGGFNVTASASAFAVFQTVRVAIYDTSTTTAAISNTGSISASAFAEANNSGAAYTDADARAVTVFQYAVGGVEVSALLENLGDIHAAATANAFGHTVYAEAVARAMGASQSASGNGAVDLLVSATLTNESLWSIDVVANATVEVTQSANAMAVAIGATQYASYAQTASGLVDNTGTISAIGHGSAAATHGIAHADVVATGIIQEVGANLRSSSTSGSTSAGPLPLSTATALVSNNGTISARADSLAVAGDDAVPASEARAKATAAGINQTVHSANIVSASVDNAWSIDVDAHALARASLGGAVATGTGIGIQQILTVAEAGIAEAALSNSGDISVKVLAEAEGAESVAQAQAAGYRVEGKDGPVTLDAINDGVFDVSATAQGSSGNAIAVGIFATGPDVTGSILNRGSIFANAFSEGTAGNASAAGILIAAGETATEISNSGLINAYAEGANATATGIMISPPFGGDAPADAAEEAPLAEFDPLQPYATIHNDGGTIWAGYSATGQASLAEDAAPAVLQGNAIFTEGAPNQVLIQLTGNNSASHADGIAAVEDGYIFGNIDISDDDVIVVSDGKTWFDGIINPDFDFEGSLEIVDGGNLLLLNGAYGPSSVFVDEFFMDETATLGVEFNANPDDHSTIIANEVSLAGRLNVIYQADLYADLTVYHGVVQANEVDAFIGAFDIVTDNSALLITSQLLR